MSKIVIKNGSIVNEGQQLTRDLLIEEGKISQVAQTIEVAGAEEIDAKGLLVLPGIIDDQVHFREPGLTHKASIATESKAAIAGGVTSFLEMPNTKPQTTTHEALDNKLAIAAQHSWANYGFYFGATNENLEALRTLDTRKACGIKVFMGSSTGNMLVDDEKTLAAIFSESPLLIATHCEDEETIKANTQHYREKHGDSIPFHFHPIIRSHEACYLSTQKAVSLAQRYNTRLHILHLSTADELSLFTPGQDITNKKITAEVCVHHLWFDDKDYDKKGAFIKWNPAVKSARDKEALREGLKAHHLDIIATDHAPHLLSEKQNSYFKAPSGGPLVQHSLLAMLELWKKGIFTLELLVEKMCHNPAKLFDIHKRGFIREGYHADLVLVNPNKKYVVDENPIHYKCEWTPFSGETFSSHIETTIVNGEIAYQKGKFAPVSYAKAIEYDR